MKSCSHGGTSACHITAWAFFSRKGIREFSDPFEHKVRHCVSQWSKLVVVEKSSVGRGALSYVSSQAPELLLAPVPRRCYLRLRPLLRASLAARLAV